MKPRTPTTAMLLLASIGGIFAGAGIDVVQTRDANANATATAEQSRTIQLGNVSRTAERNSLKNIFNSGWAIHRGPRRWPGCGWSVAIDRRRAKKARNVARNRAAHRVSA